MRKLIIFILVILLTGCSSKYTLTVEDKKITEEIIFPVEKNKLHDNRPEHHLDIYSNDVLNILKYTDLHVEVDNTDYVYDKNIVENNESVIFTLTHSYTDNSISKSRVLNECFENVNIEETENGITLNLSGQFYCLNSDEDEFIFTIKTDNIVKSPTTNHNIFTNKYIWKINKENKKDIDISIKIEYKSKISYYCLITCGVLVSLFIVFIIYRMIKSSKTNEI